jgi:ABC-type nitrate/sulfonate/bicarbonate transport system substrate-binding protein
MLLAAGGALFATGCGSTSGQTASSAAPTVVIGTARDPNLSPLILIAQHNGYFAQHGVHARVVLFSSGAQLATAAASGHIDFGSAGDAPAIDLAGSGAPVNVLAETANISGSQGLVALPTLPITAASFEHDRIGLLTGTTGQLLLYNVLAKLSVPKTAVHTVNIAGGTEVAALQKGDIQIGFLWQPWLAVAKQHIPHLKLVALANYSYLPGQTGPYHFAGIYAVLFGYLPFEKQYPKMTGAVLKSLAASAQYIRQHPTRAAHIVSQALDEPPSETATIMSENTYGLKISRQFLADEAENIRFLASIKPFHKPLTVQTWVDPEPLKKALPGLVQP